MPIASRAWRLWCVSLLPAAAALYAGCKEDSSTEPAAAPAIELKPPAQVSSPSAAAIKRLTPQQYANILHDVVDVGLAVPRALEPVAPQAGFQAVGASVATISARGTEQYEDAAFVVAKQALAPGAVRDRLVPCAPAGLADDACAGTFVRGLGRKLWRRPLGDDEVAVYVTIARKGAEALGDFHRGLEFAMAGLLQSPDFLFRIEAGEPDPGRAGVRRYTSREMATRLSFFLWNTTPDDALLDAAEAGKLVDEAALAQEVERMLASPKARAGVRAFFHEMLQLDGLDDLVKDTQIFPSASPELAADAREQTLLTVADLVIERDADYRELFTSGRTFINRRLAALYRVQAPALDGFGPVTLPPETHRVGLMGHASFLSLRAHPVATSPTLRGMFVRTQLLCNTVPPPPADVDTALPEPSTEARSLRERLTAHRQNESCKGCHALTDPVGLALEQFDSIGQFRTHDNGVLIDTTGDLDGAPFQDGQSLGQAIASHRDLPGCLTRQYFRFAKGTAEVSGEEETISQLTHNFVAQGYRIKPLLRAIATSEAFRLAREGE